MAGLEDSIRWRPGDRLEDLFEQRCDALAAEGRAGAIAVEGPAGAVSYAELDGRANQLARFLARGGARAGDRIALLFDRPLDAYVAMLAVLKLHAAYVPLDPGFPADRVGYIAADAGVRLVLSHGDLAGRLSAVGEPAKVLYLDQLETEIAGERTERLGPGELEPAADELCYVIYTSGTTGRPKGVAVGHPSICNFVRVAAEVYGVRPDDRVFQGLTIAFDFSIEEIWVAWMVGATLVPKPAGGVLLGEDLHAFLTEQRVSALCCVPTLLATLERDLPSVRFLLVSGEACPPDLARRWHRPGRRFLNVYGPTEATVSATWTVLTPGRPVTIGVPLPTYAAVVLDPDEDSVLEPGEMGELGLAGIGLADGYLGRPDLTERAFIPDFLGLERNPSGRIYRTGDLVRFTETGEIEHHGRIDTQVKIRGYRIELSEIEAVLRGESGVAQAVLDARELVPGHPELVGYYVPIAGVQSDPAAILDHLRAALPPYMVPGYLEPVAAIPMMASGKVDRRALPDPRAGSRLASDRPHVEAADEIEEAIAHALAEVLGLERVSVEDDFFDDLGANSLLMARLSARLRRAAGALPPVSMRDIYLHRTVRALASALGEPEPASEAARPSRWEEPELPEPVGTPHHLLCGVLQGIAFVVAMALLGAGSDAVGAWTFAAHGALAFYLRAALAGSALLLAVGTLPIAAKWLLIGRFRPARIRVWSLAYVRFWIVKTLLVANPLAHLIVGTPLYSLYLRALGARVGRRVLVLSQHLTVCADTLTLADDVVVNKDTYLNGYRARAGMIEIGPVVLGDGTFVGERCVLDIHTSMGAGCELGHASSLHAGQAVPAGECWYGSPALRAPADHAYRVVPPLASSRLRQARFCAGRLLALGALLAPLEAIAGALLLAHPRAFEALGLLAAPALAAAVLAGVLVLALLISLGVPRLLHRLLVPGRAYPLYGLHHTVQRLVARTSNNPLLTTLFGDSVAIVHYLRLLGWRLREVEQTGSNFGLQVTQEVPALSRMGSGTMVSDGLSMMNAEFSSTSFRVRPVVVGKRNYIGNVISFPPGARTGDDVLFATKAMVPVAGPVRSGVGLLGSPPFEIPRSVARDAQFELPAGGPDRRARLAAKTGHNLVTMALHLLVDYLLLAGVLTIAISPLDGRGWGAVGASLATTLLEVAFMLTLFVLAERFVTRLLPVRPMTCSILERGFWRHERYWKVAPNGYERILDGTTLKPLLWRLLGVRIGRRVFDDGLAITERPLVSIGADSTFAMGAALQSHTLEDGIFKSDQIAVGAGCSIGTATLVNYGTAIGDGALIGLDTFVMKGSDVEPGTWWRGNPATEVSRRPRVDNTALATAGVRADGDGRRPQQPLQEQDVT